MKLSDFEDCKVVLLLPKLNKGALAGFVTTLFDVLLFTTLKPVMLVAVVVLTGNIVPGD